MKILVMNGPNLNMLGIREKNIYGAERYDDMKELVEKISAELGVEAESINPAAYTHTSIAILDALKAVSLPAVEVHISDVKEREAFRQISYAGMACEKTIMGKGFLGYVEAIEYLVEKYK